MQNHNNRIEQFLDDKRDYISDLLRSNDKKATIKEVTDMLRTNFPDYQDTNAITAIASAVVVQLLEALKFQQSPQTVNNINITNITNITNNVADPTAAEKPKLRVKLNYRLLEDKRLKFMDRIVFSFVWGWSHWNYKKAPKPFSINKLRVSTGCRPDTIKRSLNRLTELGYIDGNHRPLITKTKGEKGKVSYTLKNGVSLKGYRRLEWEAGNGDVRDIVFKGLWSNPYKGNPRQQTTAWMAAATGVCQRQTRKNVSRLRGDKSNGTTL